MNDNLLQGPDLINSIVGVLIRFREEPVAKVADIEAMFHQVRVCEKDRDALRFLWWPSGNLETKPVEHCMNVHLFGVTSSPSCAAYSLRGTARDNAKAFSGDTLKTIERNFYVDDLLKSVTDEKVGIRLSSELRDILAKGGFRLTKWMSNNQKEKDNWNLPETASPVTLDDDDSELKTVLSMQAKQGKAASSLDDLLVKYSDWHKLLRAVGWLLRFKKYLVSKYLLSEKNVGCAANNRDLTVKEIRGATKDVLMLLQKSTYDKDFRNVVDNGRVSKACSIVNFSPVYTDVLLRIGGRLENADVSTDVKHPIILPSGHNVSRILIRKYHELNAHAGAHHILSLIRQKNYWIVHGQRTVKSVLSHCIDCKRRQQRLKTQQMGHLPTERLTPDKAPFTYVGVDYFGPMYVKSGRKHLKRYGCLFTCLTTRAVHIEIAHSLDTHSFICALQRFVSRRGRPEKIFSDNGTNITAGERELRESVKQWNQTQLSKNLPQQEIAWHFNPPYASHMGGVRGRLVRSVKNALKYVVREQLLGDEALLTLATEVEKILNDRPITQVK
ncbi:uncharacterized protein LOC128215439 [Mya arenaria]|uniref:uncharacterized protein LOC128215439 n=1 Tax=Mya arenaria TaxID=6604 RepID=UPI0022E97851|nr:uncharacterized protein LOC128215439 [Mya arenaria]